MTALANDFALFALRDFASTLKDDSSLIAEQEVKLDNKELVRSNGVLFSEGELALPSTACWPSSAHLFRTLAGRIVTFRRSQFQERH